MMQAIVHSEPHANQCDATEYGHAESSVTSFPAMAAIITNTGRERIQCIGRLPSPHPYLGVLLEAQLDLGLALHDRPPKLHCFIPVSGLASVAHCDAAQCLEYLLRRAGLS